MQLTKRDVDGVIVLDLKGSMTLGEGDELLTETISTLLAAGCREVVLNYEGVPYIDSKGLQETCTAYMRIWRQGGRVVSCNFSKRLKDLFAVTKLLSVFEVAESVEQAVAAIRREPLISSCPVCGPASSVLVRHQTSNPFHVCPRCEVAFRAEWPSAVPAAGADSSTAPRETECPVLELRFATYDNEYVRVTPGQPFLVTLDGRLDLFAFERVERVWKAIPSPRRVVFTIRDATDAGFAKLLALCDTSPDSSQAVIVATHLLAEPSAQDLPRDAPVYRDLESALDALGHCESVAVGLFVKLRRLG